MPEIKEPEKPKDEEDKKKKACEEPEKYPKEEVKAEAAPHWAIELGAKIDKLADAIIRAAAKPEEVKPEEEKPKEKEKAEAYPKPPEEEKPKEEEKQKEPEKYPYGKDEQKFKTMIEDAIKSANIPEVVKSEIAKRLVEEPIEKRAKAPGPEKESEVDVSMETLGKMSFKEVEALAKRLR